MSFSGYIRSLGARPESSDSGIAIYPALEENIKFGNNKIQKLPTERKQIRRGRGPRNFPEKIEYGN